MRNATTIIKQPESSDEGRKFEFDYSFWSHDAFKNDDQGVSRPDGDGSNYADQDHVYKCLGIQVLDNAW